MKSPRGFSVGVVFLLLALGGFSFSPLLGTETRAASAAVREAYADFNGDGFEDLAVAAPFDSIGAVPNVGTVTVLYGSTEGLGAAGNQLWHQNSPGMVRLAGMTISGRS